MEDRELRELAEMLRREAESYGPGTGRDWWGGRRYGLRLAADLLAARIGTVETRRVLARADEVTS